MLLFHQEPLEKRYPNINSQALNFMKVNVVVWSILIALSNLFDFTLGEYRINGTSTC